MNSSACNEQHGTSDCSVPESPSRSGLIEVIHDDEDRIDIEEEDRIYRAFDLDDDVVKAFRQANALSALQSRSYSQNSPKRVPHVRAPSSILSNDIWVDEQGRPEKDTSFARDVRIVGWTSVGDKQGGAYVVYDCAIITTAGTTIHVHKRYSAFALLYSTLHHTLSSSMRSQLPPLPPRAPWAKYRQGFLEKRRRALQAWLSGVLLHPEIGGCAAARDWVVKG